MSLEVPKTKMLGLQVLVDWHRNFAIQKERRKTRLEHPEKALGTKIPMLAWLLGCCVAWIWRGIVLDRERGAETFHAESTPTSEPKSASSCSKIHARIRAQNQGSTESSHPSSLCACSFQGCVVKYLERFWTDKLSAK